jgi:hypothetical protein
MEFFLEFDISSFVGHTHWNFLFSWLGFLRNSKNWSMLEKGKKDKRLKKLSKRDKKEYTLVKMFTWLHHEELHQPTKSVQQEKTVSKSLIGSWLVQKRQLIKRIPTK